jgi:uncharacterized repeat protein (TIGR02543 family)
MSVFRRLLLALILVLPGLLPGIFFPDAALAAATSQLTVTKYDTDGSVLDSITLSYSEMEAYFEIQGDGITHQYLQGPTFDPDNLWDPDETVNIKDWGANKGTDLKDLCDVVGGMSEGDTVEVKANDGLYRTYDYQNIYDPDPRQGKMAICWWMDGQYVPAWQDGMRLVFFAQTTNPDGHYVFGNWDQHECFAENRWYFYDDEYPTTTGHSVKYVNRINIYPPQPDEYDLTMSVSGSGTTSPVSGVHTYTDGSVVSLSATPASGWQFTGWTGSINNTSSNANITMDGNKTVTANFVQQEATTSEYTLSISVSGSGTTSPVPGDHVYQDGAVVNLTATPTSGWQFTGWTGSIDTSSSATTVTMDSDKTVTANFVRVYKLTISVNGGGTTSPSAGVHTYQYGTTITVTASPSTGWRFVNWTGDVANPDSWSTSIVMNGDNSITANFEITETSTYHNLTVIISGSGTTTPSAGQYSYAEGSLVSVHAEPSAGWEFVGWTGDVFESQSPDTTVSIDADKTIQANFALAAQGARKYSLTVGIDGEGTTTPPQGSYTFAENSMVEITAVPAQGWHFTGWTGKVSDPDSPDITITMDDNGNIIAHFVPVNASYSLKMKVKGSGTVKPASGLHPYTPGTVVEIAAVPADGWTFLQWTGDVVDPYSAETTVTLAGDIIVTAEFVQPESQLLPPVGALVPEAKETSHHLPWYIIAAIAGGCMIIVVLAVVIFRDLGH